MPTHFVPAQGYYHPTPPHHWVEIEQQQLKDTVTAAEQSTLFFAGDHLPRTHESARSRQDCSSVSSGLNVVLRAWQVLGDCMVTRK